MEQPLILVVDDDPASRETLADLISVAPYRVETAVDAKSLFAFLAQETPDVILLDVMMPRVNGFEICERLKEDDQWKHIPIVLITALNGRQSLMKGLEAGADEFLSKPVSGAELRVRVRNMVRLKRQYDTLQATIRLQEDIVRIAVHDMRSPLTSIYLHTNTLLFKSRLEADRWSLDVINIEARRLDCFIDDLLILIKRDKDSLRLSYSDVDLNDLVREAIQESELLAQAAEAHIRLSLPERARQFSLDANLFRRVIDNLLSNAIKHAPMESEIEVTVSYPDEREDDPDPKGGPQGVRLTVADQGSGILPEHREQIFEMGEIVNLKQRGLSNSGIGLAFCKMVVDEHSGSIYVKDNRPKGSVFVINL